MRESEYSFVHFLKKEYNIKWELLKIGDIRDWIEFDLDIT
jgi:hypothetical protein